MKQVLRLTLLLVGTAVPRAAAAAPPGSAESGLQPPRAARASPREPGRDPFRPVEESPEGGTRPPGLSGVRVAEAVVRGVVRLAAPRDAAEPGSYELVRGRLGFAIIESPSGEAFVTLPGGRLMDGVVHRIQEDGVVFLPDHDEEHEVFRALAESRSDPPGGG